MVVESRPSVIFDACRGILAELKVNNFSEDDIFAVRLALSEAFLNAVKHGNKRDPAKEIKIDYSVNPDEIKISMTDEGNGFDPDCVPDPRCDENLYKDEGRGLLLMRSYMDVVEFNEQGNRVRMVRYNKGAAPGV